MSPGQRLFLIGQYVLPQHLLSALVYRATRWRWRPWKNLLIRTIARLYRMDLHEPARRAPHEFAHFNDFFTRELRPGARPTPADPAALLCPSDGRMSQSGALEDDRLLQAKGHHYRLAELLAGRGDLVERFRGGHFATIYLAPSDYHRVHMPADGRLEETVHVPGRLFSVSPVTTRNIPGLFARNERLICLFSTAGGVRFAVILVGAMLVSSIETIWAGEVEPGREPRQKGFAEGGPELPRGAELGRFNMGSTVIVLMEPGACALEALAPETHVRQGQPLGRLLATPPAALPGETPGGNPGWTAGAAQARLTSSAGSTK